MGSHQSARMESDVWLTPPEIIAALGPFDLDPCTPMPRPWRTATAHYYAPIDGLKAPWMTPKGRKARVWLNPPYSREAVKWLRRLSMHGQGTALVFARTETSWFFETVWRSRTAAAALFLEGRLHFHFQDGTRASANAGAPSVLIAYGYEDAERLRESGLPGSYVPLSGRNHARRK